ncbi:MAG: hypothetical protein GOU99_03290 [Candidatus Altiarchaeota archaeon]|nr:hypothetical protein [Candidatus Altiarchaeota archaeon]
MIISAKKVLELSKQHKLIQDLSDREKNNPEGAGFDIRVGEIYKIGEPGFLGVSERKTPAVKTIAKYGEQASYTLNPGEFVLVKTIESVNLPADELEIEHGKFHIMAQIFPRSTLQRCGVWLMATKTDPGYHGQLTFGMANLGPVEFKFELGARIANIVFHTVTGGLVREYSGQWKGGRVAAEKKEKQN